MRHSESRIGPTEQSQAWSDLHLLAAADAAQGDKLGLSPKAAATGKLHGPHAKKTISCGISRHETQSMEQLVA